MPCPVCATSLLSPTASPFDVLSDHLRFFACHLFEMLQTPFRGHQNAWHEITLAFVHSPVHVAFAFFDRPSSWISTRSIRQMPGHFRCMAGRCAELSGQPSSAPQAACEPQDRPSNQIKSNQIPPPTPPPPLGASGQQLGGGASWRLKPRSQPPPLGTNTRAPHICGSAGDCHWHRTSWNLNCMGV